MLIKEFVQHEGNRRTFVVRRGDYAHSFRAVQECVHEIETDLGHYLDEAATQVMQYGGERYKRTWGIEYETEEDEVPEGYQQIRELEMKI